MFNFKRELLKTYNAPSIPTIGCSAGASSGGEGITEYIISLDKPLGGIVIMDFNAQSVIDKLEILHNGIKKATSGMTTANEGPFDNLYGSPTVPTNAEATAVDQFIGTAKGSIPNRDSTFLSETGITDVTRTKQQLIWFVYTEADYNIANFVIVRITGPSGTAWDLIRLCTDQTPTGITPPPMSLESGAVSSMSEPTPDNGCVLIINSNCWINTSIEGLITSGDIAYQDVEGTNPILGGNLYYKMSLVDSYVVLIDNLGVISVHTICA